MKVEWRRVGLPRPLAGKPGGQAQSRHSQSLPGPPPQCSWLRCEVYPEGTSNTNDGKSVRDGERREAEWKGGGGRKVTGSGVWGDDGSGGGRLAGSGGEGVQGADENLPHCKSETKPTRTRAKCERPIVFPQSEFAHPEIFSEVHRGRSLATDACVSL